jgi:hypothetical protein
VVGATTGLTLRTCNCTEVSFSPPGPLSKTSRRRCSTHLDQPQCQDSSTRRGRTWSVLLVRCRRHGLPKRVAPASGATTGVIRYLTADSVVSQGFRAQTASPEEDEKCAQHDTTRYDSLTSWRLGVTPRPGLVQAPEETELDRCHDGLSSIRRCCSGFPRLRRVSDGPREACCCTASASVAEISRTGGLEGTVIRPSGSPW